MVRQFQCYIDVVAHTNDSRQEGVDKEQLPIAETNPVLQTAWYHDRDKASPSLATAAASDLGAGTTQHP